MEISINTANGEIAVDGTIVYKIPKGRTIADMMEQCEGAREWDSTVKAIQNWYYGHMVEDAWCATCVSYFAEKAGVADKVPKSENVDVIKNIMNNRGMLDCTELYGGGNYKPKRGDLVFMSSRHTYLDCTHIGVISSIDYNSGRVEVISGNCDDAIKRKIYNYKTDKYIVAWGRVDYGNC